MKLFVDFESNGSHSFVEPITLACILEDKGKVADEKLFTFQVEGKWDKTAESIHRISEDTARSYEDNFSSLLDFLEKINCRVPLYFHAIKAPFYFDWGVMHGLFMLRDRSMDFYKYFTKPVSTIDLLRAKVKEGKLPSIKHNNRDSYKLDLWCKHFKIELQHHNASSDVKACYEIYKIVENLS